MPHCLPTLGLLGPLLTAWLPHALPGLLGHAALSAGSTEPTRHSVLYVDFSRGAACPLDNAQPASPALALEQLRDGSSWAAMLRCAPDSGAPLDWIMGVRHHPESAHAVLLALVDDAAGPIALQALRAGADAVLDGRSPAMVQAQLARLRQRVAPEPVGCLCLAPGCSLHADSRELRQADTTRALQPQLFRLLWALCERPGRVLNPATLRVALDIPARADSQALHTAVGRLRRLLRECGLHEHLQTVHGSGYRWADPG
jgi:DNA-binding response OmpR family regulator